MDNLGINMAQFMSWRKNSNEFDIRYREITTDANLFFIEQNSLLTKKYLHKALHQGFIEEEKIDIQYGYAVEGKGAKNISPNGLSKNGYSAKPESIVKVNKTLNKKALPAGYLQTNGTENNLVKALQILVSENVLPIQLARSLITTSSKISNEFLDIFSKDHQGDQKIEDDKVIALIKAAVLGN